MGWIDGVSKDQFKIAPKVRAFRVSNNIGIEQSRSLSLQ